MTLTASNASFDITQAQPHHIPGFMALQAQNLVTHMPESEQAGGFVTTPFTEAQLETLIAEEGITLALHEEIVIGYMVAASWQFLSIHPIFVHMVSLFDQLDGRFDAPITAHNSYQYGPVCIDRHWRGQGLLRQMFVASAAAMHNRYDYALTFVNSRNHRSRDAHIRKLGIAHLMDFDFGDQTYHMLGFTTDQPVG